MKVRIPINPSILKWARETAGYSLDEEIKRYSKLLEWEEGKIYPTYHQLETLAKRYKRQIAVFLLPNIPK